MKGSKDKLRLMRWSDDGYPPIDLRNETGNVVDLIQEVRQLRAINTDLLEACKIAKKAWRSLAIATGETGLLAEDITYQKLIKAINKATK